MGEKSNGASCYKEIGASCYTSKMPVLVVIGCFSSEWCETTRKRRQGVKKKKIRRFLIHINRILFCVYFIGKLYEETFYSFQIVL